MLWAPVAFQSGAAFAMAPEDHSAQMMEKGHCDEGMSTEDDGKSTGKTCCAAMATAIVVPSVASVEPVPRLDAPGRLPIWQDGPSFLAELPTPPPRHA